MLGACLSALTAPLAAAESSYTAARKIGGDAVEFPIRARARRNDAFVIYSYIVDHTGSVADPRIEYSNNIPEFENAVLDWLQTQSFEPATRGGMPVASKKFGRFAFIMEDKRQGASRKFGRDFRDAIVALKAGNLDKVAKSIDRMERLTQRSVFEEVWLQYTWLRYHNARGDADSAYRRLAVLKEFMRSDASRKPEERIERLGFYQPILDDAYHYEAHHNMIEDARATLRLFAKHFPDAARTKELGHHFQTLLEDTADGRFDTRGVLLPNPLYRNEPRWVGRLSHEGFSMTVTRGSVSAASLYCKDQQVEFAGIDFSAGPWQPPGQWAGCQLEVSGDQDTQFVLNQGSS